jgi:hypothetical protein
MAALAMGLLLVTATALADHVPHVVKLRAEKKMIGVHTQRLIALV